MSNVDSAKIEMPASASGCASEARMPVSAKSSGPRTASDAERALAAHAVRDGAAPGRRRSAPRAVRTSAQNVRS